MKKVWILTACLFLSCTMPDPENSQEGNRDAPVHWPETPALSENDGTVLNSYEQDIILAGQNIILRSQDEEASVSWQIGESLDEANWIISETASITFPRTGTTTVFARAWKDGAAAGNTYQWTYSVRTMYPGISEWAVNAQNSHIQSWATGIASYENTDAGEYTDASKALGRPDGSTEDAVCLGNGGSITLTFDEGIGNGPGWDFAVFENGLLQAPDSVFQELAFVEVSSDGIHFARFDCASTTASPIDSYDYLPANATIGLAGGFPIGYGTPFDLNALRNKQAVTQGLVDLSGITHVRIVDIAYPSDPGSVDSFGQPIYDPPTNPDFPYGPNGFDLTGIAVLNSASGIIP